MRYFSLALSTVMLAGFSSGVMAANDEFGAPFTDQAPEALTDKALTIEDVAAHLIEPAAGDNEQTDSQKLEEPAAAEVEQPAEEPEQSAE